MSTPIYTVDEFSTHISDLLGIFYVFPENTDFPVYVKLKDEETYLDEMDEVQQFLDDLEETEDDEDVVFPDPTAIASWMRENGVDFPTSFIIIGEAQAKVLK